MTSVVDVPRIERQTAEHLAKLYLTQADLAIWTRNKNATRIQLSTKQGVALYTFREEGRVNLATYRPIALNADLHKGLSVTLADEQGNAQVINHIPSRLFGTEVFVWVPYFNDVQWRVFPEKNYVVFAVAFKTEHIPAKQVVGALYIDKQSI